MQLYKHQEEALKLTEYNNKCAYYLDMGLGKTFVGSEKLINLGSNTNLLICQKSKIDDWVHHFKTYYPDMGIINGTKKLSEGIEYFKIVEVPFIVVINYELAFRRKELLDLKNFTLMLDESSMIQNEKAKRSKFVLSLNPKNVILLSGTPCSGKYEQLYSQIKLLGWNISKDLYWKQYIDVEYKDIGGFPMKVVTGYKNVDRLKKKLRDYGAVFMMSDEVFDLPKQIDNVMKISTTREYRKFKKDSIISISDDIELVGDTTLTKMLYERQLCSQYNKFKLEAFGDLINSTSDRLIVFYNFNEELDRLIELSRDRPISIVNGSIKDLSNYEEYNNSITFVQYQAGAMGLNLQKCNKIVYFSLTLSCELFMQSKKRVHRIGQENTCFYYYMICRNSVEENIYKSLQSGVDYTNNLFERGE